MAHRSTNSHQLKIKALPFVAKLRREPPFSSADERELKDAADSIAGPTGWHSMAAFRPDTGAHQYRFATAYQADDMQRWINESGNREPAAAEGLGRAEIDRRGRPVGARRHDRQIDWRRRRKGTASSLKRSEATRCAILYWVIVGEVTRPKG
jgi:hypothetical protein